MIGEFPRVGQTWMYGSSLVIFLLSEPEFDHYGCFVLLDTHSYSVHGAGTIDHWSHHQIMENFEQVK